MELNNDFRVTVAPTQAWKVLSDAERIAALWPGAALQEIDGDEFRGAVKVKVGSITAHFKGTATLVERDELAGRLVLKARGRDTRGQGSAKARITLSVAPDGEGTRIDVVTDLTITGKLAQLGQEAALAEVSGQLITQFAEALEADLGEGAGGGGEGGGDTPSVVEGADTPSDAPSVPSAPAEPIEVHDDAPAEGADEASPTTGADTATEASATEASATEASATEASATDTSVVDTSATKPVEPGASGPRRFDSPGNQPADLLDAAGGSVAKKLTPLGGAALALLVLVALKRRGRRRRSRRLAAALPDLPNLATAQKLGRRVAKAARKAARRR